MGDKNFFYDHSPVSRNPSSGRVNAVYRKPRIRAYGPTIEDDYADSEVVDPDAELRKQDPRRHLWTRRGSTPAMRAGEVEGYTPGYGISAFGNRSGGLSPDSDWNALFPNTAADRIAKERAVFGTPVGTKTSTERGNDWVNSGAPERNGGISRGVLMRGNPGVVTGSNRDVSSGMNFTGTRQPDGSLAIDGFSPQELNRRISAYAIPGAGPQGVRTLPTEAPGSVSITEPFVKDGQRKALVTTERIGTTPIARPPVVAATQVDAGNNPLVTIGTPVESPEDAEARRLIEAVGPMPPQYRAGKRIGGHPMTDEDWKHWNEEYKTRLAAF